MLKLCSNARAIQSCKERERLTALVCALTPKPQLSQPSAKRVRQRMSSEVRAIPLELPNHNLKPCRHSPSACSHDSPFSLADLRHATLPGCLPQWSFRLMLCFCRIVPSLSANS